jgi:hypothetical protein
LCDEKREILFEAKSGETTKKSCKCSKLEAKYFIKEGEVKAIAVEGDGAWVVDYSHSSWDGRTVIVKQAIFEFSNDINFSNCDYKTMFLSKRNCQRFMYYKEEEQRKFR